MHTCCVYAVKILLASATVPVLQDCDVSPSPLVILLCFSRCDLSPPRFHFAFAAGPLSSLSVFSLLEGGGGQPHWLAEGGRASQAERLLAICHGGRCIA